MRHPAANGTDRVASSTDTQVAVRANSRSNRKGAARAPISLHPAFPFIVTLWFAALLGLGSLMVPMPLLEQLAGATGLSAVIPQAAPPLGMKARLALSLAATIGGGLIGLLIARRVASLHRQELPAPSFAQTVAHSGVNARRPISAHDELGETGLDGTGTKGRRALAIEPDEDPGELPEITLLRAGPLLRRSPVLPLDLAEEAAHEPDEPPLDLSASEELDAVQGFSLLGADTLQPTAEAEPEPADPLPFEAKEADALPTADDEPAELPVFASIDSGPQPFAGIAASFEPEPEPEEHDNATIEEDAGMHEGKWQDGKLDEMGLVQLAQRLGSSIEKRREARAAAARTAALAYQTSLAATPMVHSPLASPPLAGNFDMAEAEEAARAMAAYFGNAAPPADAPPPEFPQPEFPRQAFQPLPDNGSPAAVRMALDTMAGIAAWDDEGGEDGEEDGDDVAHGTAASFSLPLVRHGLKQDGAADPLAHLNPFLRSAPASPRIEDEPQPTKGQVEPAVIFPDAETVGWPESPSDAISPADTRLPPIPGNSASAPPMPGNADDNERALREALLNLQRMSGAA